MFRAHRPILRRVHTAVHTTIGSVSVSNSVKASELLHSALFPILLGAWMHAVVKLVEALRYKSEGRGFYSRWCH